LQIKSFPGNKARTLSTFQNFWEKFEGVHSGAASDVVILNGENFKDRTKRGLWLID